MPLQDATSPRICGADQGILRRVSVTTHGSITSLKHGLDSERISAGLAPERSSNRFMKAAKLYVAILSNTQQYILSVLFITFRNRCLGNLCVSALYAGDVQSPRNKLAHVYFSVRGFVTLFLLNSSNAGGLALVCEFTTGSR